MRAEERRKQIINLLTAGREPISGSTLSEKLNASRQIIVQDVAVLKASGYEILSTNRGYVLNKTPLHERVFKLKHTSDQTEDELSLIVKEGGSVIDVFVWHKAYGKIKADIHIFTEADAVNYSHLIKSGKSTELMNVTSGYHYHTVRADSEEVLDKIEAVLRAHDFIAPGI